MTVGPSRGAGCLKGHARIRGGESQQWLIYPTQPLTIEVLIELAALIKALKK